VREVFRTNDPAHPGVRRILEQGQVLLGGRVTVVRRPGTIEFPEHHLDPAQTRALIRERGFKSVVGFQTRNPIHRAHEFILKSALELHDALLIQPLVGETRPGDIPAAVRLRCYEALLEAYYPRQRTLLSVLPAVMRFAGPREAVFHALIRKNYGCTHFIVGRDHAGLNGYYGPYDAQQIFDEFSPAELGVVPLRYENTFYCAVCIGMASLKTCPHPTSEHLSLSGTRVREMLARRELPPTEFTRPEVARILMELETGGSALGPG
jgi:sulfate adenylyltransferase